MAKKNTRMLSAEEERNLIIAVKEEGDLEARNTLVKHFMPMIVKASKEFARNGTMSEEDLRQEAVVGFMNAVRAFKTDSNARLGTYAKYHIKAALMRHAMDFSGPTRVGTNLPDKRVFARLRTCVSEIQQKNGGQPISEEDRDRIARELNVRPNVVRRMEARIFSTDESINHTDYTSESSDDKFLSARNVLAVPGEQGAVDREMDMAAILTRINEICEASFEDRDLEIVRARIQGDMNPSKFAELTERYSITVERIRQIQRGALETIRESLRSEGITGFDDIAC